MKSMKKAKDLFKWVEEANELAKITGLDKRFYVKVEDVHRVQFTINDEIAYDIMNRSCTIGFFNYDDFVKVIVEEYIGSVMEMVEKGNLVSYQGRKDCYDIKCDYMANNYWVRLTIACK